MNPTCADRAAVCCCSPRSMKLVGLTTAADPRIHLDLVVAAHSWGEDGILLAHCDGTIVARSCGRVNWIWVNPGRRITCIGTYDQFVFACFDDQNCCLYSLISGLRVASADLNQAVEGVAVFEHFLVCWNAHQTSITLLYRFNLEPFQELSTDSFVVNVSRVSGKICVVCAADIYWLLPNGADNYENSYLESLSHFTNSFIIDAISFEHKLCIVRSDTWSLVSLAEDGSGLETDIEVNAPVDAILTKIHSVLGGAVLETSSRLFVLLKGNNIQLLDSPFEEKGPVFSIGRSTFVNSKLEAQQLDVGRGEFKWTPHPLPVQLASERFILDESDSSVTAVHNDLRGFADGSVSGVPVFSSPVLKIDDSHAYSAHDMVRLPLQPLNVLYPADGTAVDARVTIRPSEVESSDLTYSFLGVRIFSENYVNLQRFVKDDPYSAHIAVYLVLFNLQDLETVLSKTKIDAAGIFTLEDMAIYARSHEHRKMLKVVVDILSAAWDSKRVEDLLRSGNARSLKVLASALPYMDIDQRVFAKLVRSKMNSESVPECDAILWIFELHLEALNTLILPFACLRHVTPGRVQRFASAMVKTDGARLLHDVSRALQVVAVQDSPIDTDAAATASSACNLLLASINMGSNPPFPSNESQLVEIVRMILPAIGSRVPGAKDILVKLLASRKILYHKGQQRLLIPTLSNKDWAGRIFFMKHEGGDSLRLRQPSQGVVSDVNFTGDGKSVVGVGPTFKVMWNLTRGLSGLFGFGSSHDIDAVPFS